jgi:CubicO group peptidase (beta-lactamase class C family)
MAKLIKRWMKPIWTIILVANSAAGQPRSGGGDLVDQLVSREMAARKIPGVSIAVIRDGQIIKKASYGLASVELRVAVTNSTLFHLASATKEFTGVAIMALVEDGRLALDASIRAYLPELPAAWQPVTVRNCLSHTSGLPDSVAADQVNIIPLAGGRESLLKMLGSMPVGAPGAKVVYNQTELLLLGDIIARVVGKSYESFIEDRLLKPTGISDMRWGDSWDVIPGRASLYTALEPTADRSKLRLDEKGRPVFSTTGIYAFGSKGEPDWLTPAAGLNANIDSMARWEEALWTGKIIKPASLAMMGSPFQLRDGTLGQFGLAMIVGRQDGRTTISSGGGAAVWLTTIPEIHFTAMVLTNLQASSPQTLVAKILQSYLQEKSK